MLRIINSFKNNAISPSPQLLELLKSSNVQSVRHRKPRWVPQAKSKVFRVPPRQKIPEEEQIEIQRLYNNYRTYEKSIRRFLVEKYGPKSITSTDPELIKAEFLEDFERCNALNNKWNEEQKVMREKRMAEWLEEELDYARKRIEIEKIKHIEEMEEIERIVKEQKELSKSFITRENIDEAIEKCLNNVVDYNFAIDLNGNRIEGLDGKAAAKNEEIDANKNKAVNQ